MTTSINIKVSGQTVLDDIASCQINSSDTDFCKSVTLEFKANSFWALCDPTSFFGELRIDVIIGTTTYQFLVEERDSNVQKTGVVFSVWGRSKQALLDKPYSKNILDTDTSDHPWQTGNNKVSTIISYILTNYCPYSVTVDWNVEDYMVYKDALSLNNQSPKEVIAALAEATGAELVPHDNGSLSIETYSVAEGASVESYNDMDDIVQLGESIEHASGHNAVTVYGYEQPSGYDPEDGSYQSVDAYISVEAVESDTRYVGKQFAVKVYYYHSGGFRPICSFPGGYNNSAGRRTENITEDVILIWGRGNTNKPNTNGETEVTGNENTPIEIQSVTYTVQYMAYTLRADSAGSFIVLFYFSDKSTYDRYSFTVTEYVAEEEVADVRLAAVLKWDEDATSVTAGEDATVKVYKDNSVSITEKGNSAGTEMTASAGSATEAKTETIVFTNGEANVAYPIDSISTIDWLSPDYPGSTPSFTKGSTGLIQTELIDDNDHYQIVATITYNTRYGTYTFNVPRTIDSPTLYVWVVLDKDIGTKSLSASIVWDEEEGPEEPLPGNPFISIESIGDEYPASGFYVKAYFYHSGDLKPQCLFHEGYNELHYEEVQTESITEDVVFVWGSGNTSSPNTEGKTAVTGDEDVFYEVQSVTYTVQYMEYLLESSVAGDFKAFFYFTDESAYSLYSFTVPDVDEDGEPIPDAVDFPMAAVLKWYSGEIVGTDTSISAGEYVEVGTVTSVSAGEYVEVDLFVYQPVYTVEITEQGNSANALMTSVKTDVKEITETITFQNGESNLTYPYRSNLSVEWLHPTYSPVFSVPSVVGGSKKIVQTDLVGDVDHFLMTANVTYETEYRRYKFLIPDTYTANTIKVWFELGHGIGMVSLSANVIWDEDEGPEDPDLYKDITIIIRDYIDETLRENASIYIDDSYEGVTDSDGVLNISDVQVGAHTIRVEAEGYVISSEDDLDNDAFIVVA